jgi:hypothetical protein
MKPQSCLDMYMTYYLGRWMLLKQSLSWLLYLNWMKRRKDLKTTVNIVNILFVPLINVLVQISFHYLGHFLHSNVHIASFLFSEDIFLAGENIRLPCTVCTTIIFKCFYILGFNLDSLIPLHRCEIMGSLCENMFSVATWCSSYVHWLAIAYHVFQGH